MIKEPLAKRLPGEDGVWAFVLGDMVTFTMFFATNYSVIYSPNCIICSPIFNNVTNMK